MKRRLLTCTVLVLSAAAAVAQAGGTGQDGSRQVVTAKDAPQAIGPYSQGIKAGGFVYTAGQLPIDPATNQLVGGDVAAQTDRVLKNVQAILTASGSSMDRVLKATVYLKNMADFPKMNEVYGTYFKQNPPARATIGGVALAKDALVEIEVVALAK